ncbi:MAG: hypothetical protein GFH27_549305n213 [Chloroflexi bacterium AL-W]|nr:hypothetical protein [Chloroflexi bacterium AL-N1]NOK71231.1 hypothetical protein [Chloroflexi bacterium AL-N10]NOK76520.1 hypothetical protein [Chloroflexi bacterium AL-N5]NOK83637.1 hypothetical protein [Chloroflexi bacterium AL-W]NOK92241.1 hypothetical protein [Chloroflexi bacterium AL-N15]
MEDQRKTLLFFSSMIFFITVGLLLFRWTGNNQWPLSELERWGLMFGVGNGILACGFWFLVWDSTLLQWYRSTSDANSASCTSGLRGCIASLLLTILSIGIVWGFIIISEITQQRFGASANDFWAGCSISVLLVFSGCIWLSLWLYRPGVGELLSIDEASVYLAVDIDTVKELIHHSLLQRVLSEGQWKIRRKHLDIYLSSMHSN